MQWIMVSGTCPRAQTRVPGPWNMSLRPWFFAVAIFKLIGYSKNFIRNIFNIYQLIFKYKDIFVKHFHSKFWIKFYRMFKKIFSIKVFKYFSSKPLICFSIFDKCLFKKNIWNFIENNCDIEVYVKQKQLATIGVAL